MNISFFTKTGAKVVKKKTLTIPHHTVFLSKAYFIILKT